MARQNIVLMGKKGDQVNDQRFLLMESFYLRQSVTDGAGRILEGKAGLPASR